MALAYARAKPEIVDLVNAVVEKYHGDLHAHDVTIGVLICTDPDAVQPLDDRGRPVPVLKLHGYPAAATVKITPYKQRVQGIEDAVITLDLDLWSRLKPAEREALIDHELTHVQVQFEDDDPEQPVKLDNAGRPKLKMRLHDVQLGVFDSVIRRHGDAAIDTQVVRACHERYRQSAFNWGDDMAEQTEVPSVSLEPA